MKESTAVAVSTTTTKEGIRVQNIVRSINDNALLI